jgi:hypothetical protein
MHSAKGNHNKNEQLDCSIKKWSRKIDFAFVVSCLHKKCNFVIYNDSEIDFQNETCHDEELHKRFQRVAFRQMTL